MSDKEMCAISKRNRIRRISYGVYKLVDYIPVKYDTYAEAVAIVDKDAFLFGESVLAMLELCPTNPTRIFVGTDKRIRKNIRKSIIIVKTTAKNITLYERIRSQNVEDAILECINSVKASRLITATHNALKEGYFDKLTCEKLLARINNE